MLHRARLALLVLSAGCSMSHSRFTPPDLGPWPQHSLDRPKPPVVDPGTGSPAAEAAPPPSDAVVLFDGRDASGWVDRNGAPTKWTVENGALVVAPGTGDAFSRQAFGDCQLHIEWSPPTPPRGDGQERGNSGVLIMGRYEIQVLDSYDNVTYADGQAGAVYGQYPPLVNASRPPGEWQSYDIVWHRPRFDDEGRVVQPARVTVLQNGVLVQDDVVLTGPTSHGQRPPYEKHPDRLPLELQDHGNRTRFRNVWVRDLERR